MSSLNLKVFYHVLSPVDNSRFKFHWLSYTYVFIVFSWVRIQTRLTQCIWLIFLHFFPCIALLPSASCSCYLFVEAIGSCVLCCFPVCVLQSLFQGGGQHVFLVSVSLNWFLGLEGQTLFGGGGGKEYFIAISCTPGIT